MGETKRDKHNFRHWSNAKWGELQDLWPANVKVMNEAFKMLAVFMPAFYKFRNSHPELNIGGRKFRAEDFFYLCWIMRCEDTNEGLMASLFDIIRPLNLAKSQASLKNSRLNRLGLVENIPFVRGSLYRVTADGRMLLREFCELMEECHRNQKEIHLGERMSRIYDARLTKYLAAEGCIYKRIW